LHLLFILSALLAHERNSTHLLGKRHGLIQQGGPSAPTPPAGAPWRARREGRRRRGARALEEG